MEQRLSLITLGVANLARAQAFYERLGWQRSFRKADGVAFFQLGGIALALWPRAEIAKDANVADDGGGFTAVALAYNTRTREEVDAVMAEAIAAGARLLQPAREAFWGGYYGHFADPDGHIWEVAWNPGFQIAADGSVTLPA